MVPVKSNHFLLHAGVNICPKIGKPFPNGQFQNHKLFPENVT